MPICSTESNADEACEVNMKEEATLNISSGYLYWTATRSAGISM